MRQRKHKYFSRYISEHVKRRFFSNRNAGSILVCGASQPATNSDKHFFAFFCVWVIWGGAEGGGEQRLIYFGGRTLCYARNISRTSVRAHDVTLDTSYVLR